MKNTVTKLSAGLSYLLVILAVFAGTAHAQPPSAVPEIDPSSMVTAIAALGAGYLITVSRLRRK